MVALSRPAAFVSSTGYISVATDGQASSARTRAELLDYDWEVDTRKPGSGITFTVLRGPPGARQSHTVKATLEARELIPKSGFHTGEIVEHRYDALEDPAEPTLHSQDTRSPRSLREDTRGAAASGWRG
jgi:hypothetical protein